MISRRWKVYQVSRQLRLRVCGSGFDMGQRLSGLDALQRLTSRNGWDSHQIDAATEPLRSNDLLETRSVDPLTRARRPVFRAGGAWQIVGS
jgi:hypothetical protein